MSRKGKIKQGKEKEIHDIESIKKKIEAFYVPQERNIDTPEGERKISVSDGELIETQYAVFKALSEWFKNKNNKDEIIEYFSNLLIKHYKYIKPEDGTYEVVKEALPFSVIIPKDVNPWLFYYMFIVYLENHIIEGKEV